MCRPLSTAALLFVAATALVGCGNGPTESDSDADGTCGLVSGQTLEAMAGSGELLVTGGYVAREQRSYLSCDVGTTGSPAGTLRILAYDVGGDEARANVEETRDGLEAAGTCAEITDLPSGSGYLCDRPEESQIDVGVALDDRLVRFAFYEQSRLDEVTPENVTAWAQEVDDRIRTLDDDGSDP